MNRRDFLKSASLIVAATALQPSLAGCQAVAAKTVGAWFLSFITTVGAEVVANTISDWIAGLVSEDQETMNGINTMMVQVGFNQFDGRKVYERNGIYCYEVGHQDVFNACAPFFNGVKHPQGMENIPLVEGPTIMGLALIAIELDKNNDSDTLARALIPIELVGVPERQAFGTHYNTAWVALTEFGRVEVGYTNKGIDSGTVTVSVYDRGGEAEYSRYYEINFNA